MIFIKILRIAALAPIVCATLAIAQESLTEAANPEDDGPITVLDQVVPVADEGPPEEDPVDEQTDEHELLLAEFQRYKDLKEAGSLDEAENVAKRLVEMSIRASGPTSNDTAYALNNLAVVQHETQNYEAAQQNFSAAIEIIEDNEDRLNALLINPLRGLGAAQLADDKPGLASRTFERAVHISHVNEGPHNLEQVTILEALAETNLQLGDTEAAKNNHDMIYTLNVRHYDLRSVDMVPALLRRAAWQRRTGYILDERATYRRIIRIIETSSGKDDISLIGPLMKLGESYFYVDSSQSISFQAATASSGEIYFKRAVRIAKENPESDWMTLAKAKLAIGDYYNFRAELNRARRAYRDAWELLSVEDDRLATRKMALEVLTALNVNPIPRYVGNATHTDRQLEDDSLREGHIIVSYDVSTRGRVSGLKIVEATPTEFDSMRRLVQREMRTRIFRPRYEDAEPVESINEVFTHTFFYLQGDLQKLREEAAAEADAS